MFDSFDLLNRCDLMRRLGLGALAVTVGGLAAAQGGGGGAVAAEKEVPAAIAYELPPLPYAPNALAPMIDEKVVRLHHDKHHAAYVKGLNDSLKKLEDARKANDLAAVKMLARDVAFNGSGVVLHTLYWNSMKPGGSAEPQGALRTAIDRDFGSFAAFKAEFIAAASQVQGSGWATLAWEPSGHRLIVLQIGNHQDGTVWGCTPLMVCDVWEHAYYLQYENRRPEYVDAFWKLIDWPSTAKRLDAAMK